MELLKFATEVEIDALDWCRLICFRIARHPG